ncbi:TPA: hypothetical protein OUE92_000216 [Serratia marcescens]|nr:hypothetical protein [Serratia marcescens]
MHLDNPAQTLRQFLLAVCKADPNKSLRSALCLALNLENKNVTESVLWEKTAKIMTLTYKIEDILNDYFPDEDITAPNWQKNVTEFFSQININNPVHHYSNVIKPETFNELGLLALLFKTKGEIGKLANEDIDDIQQQLSELKQSVIESNLSQELRKDILHYLNNIIRSLEDYSITGIEPVISSIEATLGHACISQPFQEVVKNTEIGAKLKGVLKKSLSAVSSVEGVVSLGANAITLIEHFSK